MGKLKPRASFSATSASSLAREEREPSISGRFKIAGVLAVGKEVNLILMLKNLTSDTKTVTVNMTAWTIVYNGTLVHEVWKDSVTKSLNPEEGNATCRLLGCHIFMVAGILLGLEHSYWNQINWLRKETAHGEQYKGG